MAFDGDLRSFLKALRAQSHPLPGMEAFSRRKVADLEAEAACCTDPTRRADLLQIAQGWRWAGAKVRAMRRGTVH